MSRLQKLNAFKLPLTAAILLAGSIAIAAESSSDRMSTMATYEVVFIPSWNPASHAQDYPITHGKKGLLTPMIGATHGSDFQLFAAGQKPTPGLERLSEMGKHDPLDAEIKAAIATGKAGSLIEASVGSEGPVHAPVSLSFDISKDYSTVSLVGMIAPSPDWFYGVTTELIADGQWAASRVVPAYAWDSGGDAGMRYMADDADLEPKQPSELSDAPVFVQNGNRTPVGVFVFKLVPSSMD